MDRLAEKLRVTAQMFMQTSSLVNTTPTQSPPHLVAMPLINESYDSLPCKSLYHLSNIAFLPQSCPIPDARQDISSQPWFLVYSALGILPEHTLCPAEPVQRKASVAH